jgi:Ser/Thr protein kinase RdoA (MazF antagonist)
MMFNSSLSLSRRSTPMSLLMLLLTVLTVWEASGASEKASASGDEARRKLQVPDFPISEVSDFVEKHFGIHANRVKPESSYDDTNFKVRAKSGEKYLLKFHNGVDSDNYKTIHAQDAMMRHLKANGIMCSSPVSPVAGGVCSVVCACKGNKARPRKFVVRLLNWVEGTPMKYSAKDLSVPVSLKLLENLGGYLARVDIAMVDFGHAGTQRKHLWDSQQCEGIKQFIPYLKDPKREAIVQDVLEMFKSKQELLSKCPMQVIHGDPNDGNVIVNDDASEVIGIIDFGDLVSSWRAHNLGVAMAYAMPYGAIDAAIAVYRGYAKENKLTTAEVKCLWDFVSVRLVTSASLGAYTSAHAPEDECSNIHDGNWDALKAIGEQDREVLDAMLEL